MQLESFDTFAEGHGLGRMYQWHPRCVVVNDLLRLAIHQRALRQVGFTSRCYENLMQFVTFVESHVLRRFDGCQLVEQHIEKVVRISIVSSS